MAKPPRKAPTRDGKRRAGRPPIEVDLKQLEALGAIQCTDDEIAAVLGCSTDTIGRRKKEDPDFAETLKRGKEQGKVSLWRLQWKAAQNGNIAMLIWLGKQILGQRDRVEQDSSVRIEMGEVGELDRWDVARAREFLARTRPPS